jgi:uncharacterized membrane protein (DUF2068 family)
VKTIGTETKQSRIARARFIGFELIGAYKLISGLVALALGIWACCFLNHDPEGSLNRVLLRAGLDPHNHVIHSAVSAVTRVDRKHLHAIEAGTFAYAILHFIEGIGLILGRDWAGYLVVFATSSLIPFEIFEIWRKLNFLRIALLCLNVAIVIFLVATLRRSAAQKLRV